MASKDIEKLVPKNGVSKEMYTKCANEPATGKIDLSGRNLSTLCEGELNSLIVVPGNITSLNLSNNLFYEVPLEILLLQNLTELDLSNNKIEEFDEVPAFCHTIEKLNLSNNYLYRPPFWIWHESPKKLKELNISNNSQVFNILNNCIDEYAQCINTIQVFKMYNCGMKSSIKLKQFFTSIRRTKELIIGVCDERVFTSNKLEEYPSSGLSECCEIERLIAPNVSMYSISKDINKYKLIRELNLCGNNISILPIEFCDLEYLEVCLLSHNALIYLPDMFVKLKSLRILHLDFNDICMLPENLWTLTKLTCLDVYHNALDEITYDYTHIEELDFALNNCEEPDDELYLEKKLKLRKENSCENRTDGRRMDIQPNVDLDSSSHDLGSDDDDDGRSSDEDSPQEYPEVDSEEDWDSEQYWEPNFVERYQPEPAPNQWLRFIERKIADGNFCPIDLHTVPMVDQINYERQCNPPPDEYISDGQFDTDDDTS